MASWRPLTTNDIAAVARVTAIIHADLPESDNVFAERVKLFPEGCLALVDDKGELFGYAISHPIRHGHPPELNGMLEKIAPDADQYYIHDVCVLPALRGQGLAAQAIQKLLAIANGYPSACLISVYGTAKFWGRYGFLPPPSGINPDLSRKLLGYGDEATYLERRKDDSRP